jgi:hypothetical protein
LSSFKVSCKIIGSGTALTNSNYNANTNKLNSTQYALATDLKNISSSTLSMNNINTSISTLNISTGSFRTDLNNISST